MIFQTVKDVIAETVLSFDHRYLKTGANFYAVDAKIRVKILRKFSGKPFPKVKTLISGLV